jgi:prepilin-type N-terminal cleavage/methylation domain-containing protein
VLRRLRIAEAGFTLIELLVGMMLSLLVCSMALDLIPTASSSQRATTARENALVAVQAAVAWITREARAATAAAVQTPSVLDLTLPLRGSASTVHVRYDCGGGACVRYVCSNVVTGSLVGAGCAAPLSSAEVVSGLADGDVFAGVLGSAGAATAGVGIASGSTPTMDHLQVAMRVDVPGSHLPIEIDDGTAFANFSI